MKKLIILLTLLLTVSLYTVPAHAFENDNLSSYQTYLEQLNDEYGTNFHIIEEDEYYQDLYDTVWQLSYTEYLNTILNKDLDTIRQECLNIINLETMINVDINNVIDTYSTQATKTVYFNNECNKMTLTYKYTTSGGAKVFDTSYKPTATVIKVSTTNYFTMSSYTGSFKNSNKTYSVVAKGNVHSLYGATAKTFTVNFNL